MTRLLILVLVAGNLLLGITLLNQSNITQVTGPEHKRLPVDPLANTNSANHGPAQPITIDGKVLVDSEGKFRLRQGNVFEQITCTGFTMVDNQGKSVVSIQSIDGTTGLWLMGLGKEGCGIALTCHNRQHAISLFDFTKPHTEGFQWSVSLNQDNNPVVQYLPPGKKHVEIVPWPQTPSSE